MNSAQGYVAVTAYSVLLIWDREPDASLLHKPADLHIELCSNRRLRKINPVQLHHHEDIKLVSFYFFLFSICFVWSCMAVQVCLKGKTPQNMLFHNGLAFENKIGRA